MLGAIDLLFAGFVSVQIRYFFGGADLIEAVPGLTRAEYARSGFFELVTVAALVLLLLLFVDWVATRSRRALAVTRLLAAQQIALVTVMLVSAWIRMQLYVDEFGLTELRLYTSAFMLWLAAVLAWFCCSVLAGRRERFATGTTSPQCQNETYNINNGDVFVWQNVWPTIADALGMEVGPPQSCCLAEEMAKRDAEWATIVKKYNLQSPSSIRDYVGQSFFFADAIFAHGVKALPAAMLVSLRRASMSSTTVWIRKICFGSGLSGFKSYGCCRRCEQDGMYEIRHHS